jgi:hypothetical protein
MFQKYTFEKFGDQVRLVAMEASKGLDTELAHSVDALLESPNERHSTPIERCQQPGATGYHYVPRR